MPIAYGTAYRMMHTRGKVTAGERVLILGASGGVGTCCLQLAKAAGKYTGRKADTATHQRIVALRRAGQTIKRTAELAGCSISQAKRIWALHRVQS